MNFGCLESYFIWILDLLSCPLSHKGYKLYFNIKVQDMISWFMGEFMPAISEFVDQLTKLSSLSCHLIHLHLTRVMNRQMRLVYGFINIEEISEDLSRWTLIRWYMVIISTDNFSRISIGQSKFLFESVNLNLPVSEPFYLIR